MINSQQNARIKEVRKLQERRHRHKRQQFLVEGVRLIGDALQSQVYPAMLFYAPQLVENNPAATQLVQQIAAELPAVECLACSQAVFGTLSDTVTPQGVIAVFALPQLISPVAPTLTLILDNVREPGNAGTLLRSAEAAGVELVIFGPGTVDPFNSKVVRSAMGSHFRLPIQTCPTWSQIGNYLPTEYSLYLAQSRAEQGYDQVDWQQPAALVVSGETADASLAAQELSQPIAIPMFGSVESLNAAMAGTVILFEAARQRRCP